MYICDFFKLSFLKIHLIKFYVDLFHRFLKAAGSFVEKPNFKGHMGLGGGKSTFTPSFLRRQFVPSFARFLH